MDNEVNFKMNSKQGENEIKYRLSVIILEDMLAKELITKDEMVKLKKKLIRKYKPVIECLEAKL